MFDAEYMARLQECMANVAGIWQEQIKQVASVVIPAVKRINDIAYQAYQNADMPYGDTHEGMLHWMQDISDISRHEQEIERIKRRHETLAHARMLGERIRQKRGEII